MKRTGRLARMLERDRQELAERRRPRVMAAEAVADKERRRERWRRFWPRGDGTHETNEPNNDE